MARLSRRHVIQMTGLGILGVAARGQEAGSPLPASADNDIVDGLRLRLKERRERMRTLQFTWESALTYVESKMENASELGSLRSLAEGTTDFYYDSGRYRLTHRRSLYTEDESLVHGRYVRRIKDGGQGEKDRVTYDGPVTNRQHPKLTLARVLPVPENKPSHFEGVLYHHGEQHYVFLQGENRYWVSADSGDLNRLDVFADSRTVGVTALFEKPVEPVPGVRIPTRITSKRFSPEGDLLIVAEVKLHGILVNEKIPVDVFEIRR